MSSEEAVDIVLSRAAILVVTCVPPAQEIEIEGADGDRRLLQWGGVVDDLSAGTTWVVAKNPGRAPSSKRVELKEGETTRVDLDLKAGSTLEGTCTSDDGGPVAGASVVATDPASGPIGATSVATSDAEGRYRLAGQWAPAPFLKGKLQRLTTPQVTIRGDATLKDRILDGELAVGSPALRAVSM